MASRKSNFQAKKDNVGAKPHQGSAQNTGDIGALIGKLDAAALIKDVAVFHAGTKRNDKGEVIASGGRVLAVAATGKDAAAAQALAYRGVDAIDWPGGFCRRDIGWRAIGRK